MKSVGRYPRVKKSEKNQDKRERVEREDRTSASRV
nr:MAG TPA: hypothetical protein [Caudoviricetes sp.]